MMIDWKSAVDRLFSIAFIMNRDTSVYRSSVHRIIGTWDNVIMSHWIMYHRVTEHWVIRWLRHSGILSSRYQVIKSSRHQGSKSSSHTAFIVSNIQSTKLLQKSEMRKDIVIELSYKGFSWSGDNSWGHYNPCRSQILTPQRYLFVTMPENATNGYE